MNDIKKVCKAEFCRSVKSTTIFILLGVFFLLQLIGYFFFMDRTSHSMESGRYIYVQSDYDARVELHKFHKWDEQEEDYLALYKFVKIKMKNDYWDYASIQGRNSYGLKATVVWRFWQVFTSINLILLLLAVMFPVFFFREYANGGIKNHLIAGISRQKVFWGKWLVMLSTVSIAFFGTLLLGTLFGGRYLYSPLLISIEGKAKAICFAETFFTKAISFYVMMVLFSTFTAFLTIKTRSLGVSLTIPYVIIVVFGIAEFVFAKVSIPKFYFNTRTFVLSLIPVFHSFLDPNPAFSWQLGTYTAVDVLLVGTLLGLLNKAVRRQDA